MKILSCHAAASLAGHFLDANRNLTLVACALSHKQAADIYPGQVAGGSDLFEVDIYLRLLKLLMKPERVDSGLDCQVTNRKAAWKLPLAIDLLRAAYRADNNLHLIRAA